MLSASDKLNFPSERNNAGQLAPLQQIRLARLLYTGDPLADALIEDLPRHRHGRQILMNGIQLGLSSLDSPPSAIEAFLQDAETVPPWMDEEAHKKPVAGYLSVPRTWFEISVIASLFHLYSSPAIAAVLMQTGKISQNAAERFAEAGKWIDKVMVPGALLRGQPGYVATVRVRLVHAHVRAVCLQQGWDVDKWGVPINQLDMARTWLSFAYVPILTLDKLGFSLVHLDLKPHFRLWEYIGQLLGIEPDLIVDIDELTELSDAANGAPGEDSRVLAAGLLDYAVRSCQKWPLNKLSRSAACAVSRVALGNNMADALAIPHTVLQRLMLAVVANNRRRYKRCLSSLSSPSNHHR